MTALWFLLSYLIGAFPTSYLAARVGAGIDLRDHGSKNLGATNVYRVLGAKYAIPVGLIDLVKGLGPVLAFGDRVGLGEWGPLAIGAAAIVGHVFPVYLGFRGGKGVATAAGVVLGAAPLPFVVSLATWALVVSTLRIMSVGSMLAAIAFPVGVLIFAPGNTPVLTAGIVIAAFILFTHRSNIKRLVNGKESQLTRNVSAEGTGP